MKTRTKVAIGAAAAGTTAVGVYLLTKTENQLKSMLYDTSDKAVKKLTRAVVSCMAHGSAVPDADKVDRSGFMPGTGELMSVVSRSNVWRLGFAQESIAPYDTRFKDYYIGGFLHFPPNVCSGILDDMFVRAVCLDDSSGRGMSVFISVDCIGIASGDVRELRRKLARFARENNIVSINVCSTHCHSAIDTQGLWGPLKDKFRENLRAINSDSVENVVSGRNDIFMDSLFAAACGCVRRATADMREGKLYSGVIDGSEYIRAKREPHIRVSDITTLRFVPSDGSRQTVAVLMGAHPIAMGYHNTLVSGDYPHYLVAELEALGANGIFFQGAELAVTTDRHLIETPEGAGEHADVIGYGRAIARLAMTQPRSAEKVVAPLLNIRLREIAVPVDNEILLAVGRLYLSRNTFFRDEGKYYILTEVGYAELGRNLRLALVPGEIAPELIVGGVMPIEKSYRKQAWGLPAVKDMAPQGCHTAVLGLANDAIGYIIPDNCYGSIFAPGHYEESVSAGGRAASTIISALRDIIEEMKV